MSGKLLQAEALTQAWTPARLKDGTTAGYGLGWGIGRVAGHREMQHSGAYATGFSSFLAIYPDDHLAVVVLLNRNGADHDRIARSVAGIYIHELAPRPEKPVEGKKP